MSGMSVNVERVKGVESLAIEACNERNGQSFNQASHKSERSFLDRICVNFIRHELTEYDVSLEAVAGKTGITEAVDAIRDKVYAAIATCYPVYKAECEKQKEARREDRLQ